jgi:hypothetical protein
MDLKKITKEICLKPVLNKKNGQYNFSLKKNKLPKEVKSRLPKLKSIKLKMGDFEFY